LSKLIIIAVLLFSHAVFASPTQARANLKKILSCEASMAVTLNPGHQDLLERLRTLAEKYEIISLTTPDFVANNMGISISAFYSELTSLAQRIVELKQPGHIPDLDLILTDLEARVALALVPREPKHTREIPGKRRMETRMFDDDWSDLAPRPSGPSAGVNIAPSQLGDFPMPSGPHDFNKATRSGQEPAVKTEIQQQQQQLRPLNPGRPAIYPPDDLGFRPYWPPREKP